MIKNGKEEGLSTRLEIPNARKIRDVHVTFVTYMHCVHVEIFTQ